MPNGNFDTQVAIIGSGFGGSVAAWRFAEAGHKTLVIEVVNG
ncbi:NAD(P)/FAD-dependent oxidoreductase [candidate division KSB1 bacterium]|nr:NAD(P)/FAD-dependent oxidoreductase [candidate division KSB1 bacterium]TDI84111.1 MAG: NAD(P)/FAD-dependent oxidoreductase [Caldithrix sp.]